MVPVVRGQAVQDRQASAEGGDEGDGQNTGGQLGASGGGDQGGGGRRPRTRIAVRSLPDPDDDRNYSLIIRAAKDYQGSLLVEELTEDGRASNLEIEEARDETGALLKTTRNKMEPLTVSI